MSAEVELARLEREVLGITRVKTFLDQVDALRRMLAREDPGIREAVLRLVAPAIGRELGAAVGAGWNLGILDAVRTLDAPEPAGIPKAVPKPLVYLARGAEARLRSDVADARKLARAGADEATILSKVFGASNGLKRDVTSIVNRAGNAGVTAVADLARVPTVWVAEYNACVTCLRYSGETAKPGKNFPAGLSYGKRSTMLEAAPHPPAHPHCRCTVEPLNDQSYADALRREADRSVLRGFSLESEPMSIRLDAAARLLATGVEAPKSVKAYAARSVKSGEFSTRGRP